MDIAGTAKDPYALYVSEMGHKQVREAMLKDRSTKGVRSMRSLLCASR